jgi:hypothetical protein
MTYETRTEAHAALMGISFLDMEDDRERAEWQAEQDYLDARDEWQNRQAERASERFVGYNDVRDPDEAVVRVPDFTFVPGAYDA